MDKWISGSEDYFGCSEEKVESRGKALNLLICLCSDLHPLYYHEVWVMTERTRSLVQAANMNNFQNFGDKVGALSPGGNSD